MEEHHKKENGITEGVIWKQLLYFFFPMLFGTFFQQLYNTADAVVVGKYVGKEALSAVGGPTGTLINVFVGFFMGVSAGATVVIAQYYGGKKDEEVSKSVHTAMALAIAGGLVIMVLGQIFVPYALKWMGTPEDILSHAIIYVRIYFSGMIANLIYNIGAGILRAIGDSKRPLYFLITSCMVNIVLDLIFVLAFHWDVAGVAIATVISQICSAVLVCRTLMRTNESYKLHWKKVGFDMHILKKIIYIGLPAGFQSLMYTVSNVVIQTNINNFGTDTVAAWVAYEKIDGIYWTSMSAFGISITTFVGQNFGAGKLDRVSKGIKVCLAMAMTTAVGMTMIFYHFGGYVYYLFTSDIQVIQIGIGMMKFMVPFYAAYVCVEIFSGSLRGMGDAIMPMVISLLGICALRILWLFIAIPIWPDIKTVMTSYPITWSITSVLFILYYLYKKKNVKIELPA